MDKPSLVNKKLSERYPHDYIDDRIKTVLKLIKTDPKARYLDIGCSNGVVTKRIAAEIKTKEIYGIDIANIKLARDKGIKVNELDLNLDESLPYQDNFFDVITCFDTLEHIYNTDFIVREMFRILKTGGCVIISVPRTDSLVNIVLLIMGYQPLSGSCSLERNFGTFSDNRISGHMAHFTKKSLIEMFRYYGFKIDKYCEASCMGAWLGDQLAVGNKVTFLKRLLASIIRSIPYKKETSILKATK
jgi:2-polyprenyl-3-methyl-5-hydroxy-6-metoxy-1,4-benzoquinol methylase